MSHRRKRYQLFRYVAIFWYITTPTINEWAEVTADEVEKLIGSALSKSCQLDPASTWLVKDMRRLLLPFVALLFKKSLKTGCFPATFKIAVIRPLLKKSGLDSNQPKNYRPVSNTVQSAISFEVIGKSCSDPSGAATIWCQRRNLHIVSVTGSQHWDCCDCRL